MSNITITMQMWRRWSLDVDARLCPVLPLRPFCILTSGIPGLGLELMDNQALKQGGNDFCNTIEAQFLAQRCFIYLFLMEIWNFQRLSAQSGIMCYSSTPNWLTVLS